MKRTALVCGLAFLLTSAACGGGSSSPTAPARSGGGSASTGTTSVSSGGGSSSLAAPSGSSSAPGGFGVIVSGPSSVLGASGLAACFGGSPDASCFSAARLGTRAVGAAATAPGAPGTLSASVAGGTVTLGWGAPTSGDAVVSYILEAGSAPGLSNLANSDINSTATSYVATGVGPGTYFVRVRARNSGGVSATSNEIAVVVGPPGPAQCVGAPGAPSGLTGSATGSTVFLSWVASSGSPTTYFVEAGSSSGSSNLANSDLGGTATTLTATGVGSGRYYIRMRARNACGTSATSNEIVLSVGTSTAPTTLFIQSWGASLEVERLGGGGSYMTTGQIDMTVSIPIIGLHRGEFNNAWAIGAGQVFTGYTRDLHFYIFKITDGCPDLHGTIPLVLYNGAGTALASIPATLHETGCAFSP